MKPKMAVRMRFRERRIFERNSISGQAVNARVRGVIDHRHLRADAQRVVGIARYTLNPEKCFAIAGLEGVLDRERVVRARYARTRLVRLDCARQTGACYGTGSEPADAARAGRDARISGVMSLNVTLAVARTPT